MPNMLDYLEWRGDLTLAQSPFGQADNLILSQLAYVPLEGIVPGSFREWLTVGESAAAFLALPFAEKRLLKKEDRRLLELLRESPRFRDMKLLGCVSTVNRQREEQFAALTVELEPGVWFLAFRGTDLTLTGWKEDLNMSFLSPVPSQQNGVDYLHRAAAELEGEFLLGGHSKGGNLAVYAGVFCREEVRERIRRIYNNDGPGFLAQVVQSPSFREMAERVETYLPQSSVVGMLLEHQENYRVVASDKTGLMQHDTYSWQIRRAGFLCLEEVSQSSILLDRALTDWLSELSSEDREAFVETLFSILETTGAATLTDLTGRWYRNVRSVVEAMEELDPEMKKMLQHSFARLLKSAGRSVADYLREQTTSLLKRENEGRK